MATIGVSVCGPAGLLCILYHGLPTGSDMMNLCDASDPAADFRRVLYR